MVTIKLMKAHLASSPKLTFSSQAMLDGYITSTLQRRFVELFTSFHFALFSLSSKLTKYRCPLQHLNFSVKKSQPDSKAVLRITS